MLICHLINTASVPLLTDINIINNIYEDAKGVLSSTNELSSTVSADGIESKLLFGVRELSRVGNI